MHWVYITLLSAIASPPASQPAGAPATAAIIPRPARIEAAVGEFSLGAATKIVVDPETPESRAVAEYLAAQLRADAGAEMKVMGPGDDPLRGAIYLHAREAFRAIGDEGYELHVSPDSCAIKARTPRGLFYGVQSLRQLLPPGRAAAIPCVHISDRPRYRHRGMLLDCCRHFMPKEFVKRYIDLLAFHKMNVLHWHLTEDQGWRIEIKKHPQLTEVGAWRQATRDSEQPRDAQGRYGGFYSQEDVREIVAYAASRYVTVIPEIEMPGHSVAALAAYPELSCTGGPFEVSTRWGVHEDVYCAGNDRTFQFLEEVLSEVIELFPSQYIHVGGDECPKTRWKACEKCQARIKSEGLKDEHELQSWFIRRMEKFLSGKGRRLIGWDEILEGGLAPNATVQSWRGMDGALAAARSGHDVISSPTTHCYLDYAQGHTPGEPLIMGLIPLEKSYAFEPTPAELSADQAAHVLGLEGNLWSEHAPPGLVDRQVFPRLCALAEVGWSPAAARNWDDFSARLRVHYPRLDALGVTYYVPAPEISIRPEAEPAEIVLVNPLPAGDIHYTLDGGEPDAQFPRYTAPLRLSKPAVLRARIVLRGRLGQIGEFRVPPPDETETRPAQ